MSEIPKQFTTAIKYGKYIDTALLKKYAGEQAIEVDRFLESFLIKINNNIIIFFTNGVVVQWGEKEIDVAVKQIIKKSVKKPLGTVLSQTFKFVSQQPKFSISDDVFHLTDMDPLYLVSISHALARSVQLEYNELSIHSVLESIEALPTEMKKFGKIKLKSQPMRKLIGLVMETQHSVSVFGLADDKPELLWEEPRMIPFYKETAHYLELHERWGVLSEKMQYLDSTFSLLRDEMHARRSHMLEWIIIILILFEVVHAFF